MCSASRHPASATCHFARFSQGEALVGESLWTRLIARQALLTKSYRFQSNPGAKRLSVSTHVATRPDVQRALPGRGWARPHFRVHRNMDRRGCSTRASAVHGVGSSWRALADAREGVEVACGGLRRRRGRQARSNGGRGGGGEEDGSERKCPARAGFCDKASHNNLLRKKKNAGMRGINHESYSVGRGPGEGG